MKNLNHTLRKLRKINLLTLDELGEAISISKSQLCEIESGKKAISLETLNKYASHFKIPSWAIIFSCEQDPIQLQGIISEELMTLMQIATQEHL